MELDLSVQDVSPVSSGSKAHKRFANPSAVRARIEELAEPTLADEIMVTTNVYDHGERLRSYERLAAAFETATPGK